MDKMKKVLSFFAFALLLIVALPLLSSEAFAADPNTPALDQYFINFILKVRTPLAKLVGIIGFAMGIVMEISALLRITKPGFTHGKGTPGGTVAMLVIGAMLISLPATINIFEKTVFGVTQTNYAMDQSWEQADLSYMSATTSGSAARNARVLSAINAAFQYIRILGLIAFIRGLYLLKSAVDGGQSSIMSASLHMIGGVLAMNIAPLLRIFFATVN
jgi:hypothetical protein